jgi:hypothetical protein
MDLSAIIIELSEKVDKFRTKDIASYLKDKNRDPVTRQYIISVVKRLIEEGKLLKGGSTKKAFYVNPKNIAVLDTYVKKRLKNEDLKEHEVLDDLHKQKAFIDSLNDNVSSIFSYAFSEMLNNAIEHSQSKDIEIEVEKKDEKLEFMVNDFGIGVFKNVMKKKHLKSELEAIQEILKGKMTTQPQAHSGEGIFFTSKVADIFILESFGYRLRIDNIIEDIFVEEQKPSKQGTRVYFCLDGNSKKHLNDVFKRYQTGSEDMSFNKTEVHVKLYTMGTIYVSRSQARRVVSNLDKFTSVVLDFDKVPTIGQAFADEIFRVFQTKHPKIMINAINMNEAVKFMIDRVEKPKT